MKPAVVSAPDGSTWLVKDTVPPEPSSIGPLLPRTAVGATLLTVTVTNWLSVSDAPSESVTVAVTFVVAGPSGKKHLKLPRPVASTNVSDRATFVAWAPQAVTTVWVSWPGSVTVNV